MADHTGMLLWGDMPTGLRESKPGGGTRELMAQVRHHPREARSQRHGVQGLWGLFQVKPMRLRGDLQALTGL